MKIAIAATENHIKSKVDPHFGRCDWFGIYDSDLKSMEYLENSARHQQEKAGQLAADFLLAKGIHMAIAGRFGSKVVDVFRKNDVQMVVPDASKTLSEIVSQIK